MVSECAGRWDDMWIVFTLVLPLFSWWNIFRLDNRVDVLLVHSILQISLSYFY